MKESATIPLYSSSIENVNISIAPLFYCKWNAPMDAGWIKWLLDPTILFYCVCVLFFLLFFVVHLSWLVNQVTARSTWTPDRHTCMSLLDIFKTMGINMELWWPYIRQICCQKTAVATELLTGRGLPMSTIGTLGTRSWGGDSCPGSRRPNNDLQVCIWV